MNNNKLDKLALVVQMIESAEKSIQSAKQMLREMMGSRGESAGALAEKAHGLSAAIAGGKIIEGVFDGQNMIGPDKKVYPVPANYASKSKLIEGDVLKLTIAEDGSFIYKQIGPVERKKMLGMLSQDETGQYRVIAGGRSYKVLLASLTYFKAEIGDEITIVVPKDSEANWAAVENVIKAGTSSSAGTSGAAETGENPLPKRNADPDADMELAE
ncbi:MAG: hypothetical protein A2722_01320 [Candidatus Doudnabacteria bacterium RIFCSPHIGHO2_01_FULL_50_11]|uniref:50S ribosomal protein L7/L12 n=1 Tax=Candidatus Doudnabacteria bacterium RIFCSPHIGHO2_01_FULL_50_11 TaxID=1817828 RepID=A0A1F5PHH9_9BACT|nr:MAG: hypothetical protein A2722_01320 [Candidatus Doudnabacteria bacterium RIFCSPHIGHO2_01_FULL_50_11]